MNLNEEAKRVHAANHKWWHDLHTGERLDRNKGELLMLVISEIAECMEGERKNLKDDHLPHRNMAEVEMADALIRLLDYAGAFEIDFAFCDNMEPLLEFAKVPENKGKALYDIVGFIAKEPQDDYEIVNSAIFGIFAYCNKFGYDLEGAYEDKMAYNATRADHQKEARLAENGKKW